MPKVVALGRSDLTSPRLTTRKTRLLTTSGISGQDLTTNTAKRRLRCRASAPPSPTISQTPPPSPTTSQSRAPRRSSPHNLKRARKARITAKIGEERASDAQNTSGDLRAAYTNNMNIERARKATITAKLSTKAALEAGGVIFILHDQKQHHL